MSDQVLTPEASAVRRVVADLGNSRLKWAESDRKLGLKPVLAQGLRQPWADSVQARPGDAWAVSSVNPIAAEALARRLNDQGVERVRWFLSAADVPMPCGHALESPQRTGADRALGVSEAVAKLGAHTGGIVVSVGSALVVERIEPGGRWQGGAISAGFGAAARALRQSTAQLPEIDVPDDPQPWGRDSKSALAAGLFWGLVGAARELIALQKADLPRNAWTLWTGGDAQRVALRVDGPHALIEPDLVLQGLLRAMIEEWTP